MNEINLNKEQCEILNILSREIAEWADKNFPVHKPKLGILEEIGEATHCYLKRLQKIRGFDSLEFYLEQMEDAIADAAVYLLHDASMEQVIFTHSVSIAMTDRDSYKDTFLIETILAALAEAAANNIQGSPFYAGGGIKESILGGLNDLSRAHGFNLIEIVEKTWNKVKQRNWKKNQQTGN